MFTGKVYRSIAVLLLLGGVLYLFMATGINSGVNFRGVVLLQPVPAETETNTDPVPQLAIRTRAAVIQVEAVDKHITEPTSTDIYQKNKINIDPTIMPINEQINKTVSVNMHKVITTVNVQSSERKPILSTRFDDVINKSVPILSDKRIVLIIAYMRTGSTLTASLFQEYAGTFYAFEPIRALTNRFKEQRKENRTYTTLHYIHGKQRNYTLQQKKEVILDEINSWLTCKLDALSQESLDDEFHKYYTKIMRTFYLCSKGAMAHFKNARAAKKHSRIRPSLRQYFETSKQIDSCLKSAIDSCNKAELRELKFIRLRMKDAAKLLPSYPNMKIIHLVRDPRGIMNSRIKVKAIAPRIYEKDINDLCSDLNNDLKHSKLILQQYPDRLKIIHYEDMAENPMETSRSLVEFSGLEFSKSMQDFIRKQTSSTRDTCAYCTQRRNSSITAHRWRTQLHPKYAKYIYNRCRLSNSILGYLPLPTVDAMRDIAIPSRSIVDANKKLLQNKNFEMQ